MKYTTKNQLRLTAKTVHATLPAVISLAVLFALLLSGCSTVKPTVFLNRDYNFAYVERVAIVPFENLSNDQGAGPRLTHLFMTELLAAEAFDIVEPGEVIKALGKYTLPRKDLLTVDQIKELGKTLGVQALIIGTVNESTNNRSSGGPATVVTLDVRMMETEEGQIVWSATDTEGSRTFLSSLFGTEQRSYSEVARRCVRKTIDTLID
jgi:TolB-like protein